MDWKKGVLGFLVVLALAVLGCGGSERLKTHTYRFTPSVDLESPEDYQKAYASEYGAWFFRRLLYGTDEALAAPGRRKFIRQSVARNSVSVRDTALSHQRLEVYLRSIAGAEPDLSRLEPDAVYVFRKHLFEEPPRSFREAHIRARYAQQVAEDLSEHLQLPQKEDKVSDWGRHCLIYDRWQGWIDLFCTPQKWPEVRTFLESLRPPEPFFTYDSLFDPNNAALYYYRAADLLVEVPGARPPYDTGVFALAEGADQSSFPLEAALEPYEEILSTVLLARQSFECDLKPIVPETPDSPQPCARDEMLALARLLAAKSRSLDLLDQPQEALEHAVLIVKMGCDWNHGPICHRLLGADLVDLGCRSVARFFLQPRSRALSLQAAEEIHKYCRCDEPLELEAFDESVRPYHAEAQFESQIVQDYLAKRIEDAFVRTRAARVQAEVVRLRALVLAYQHDRGAFPETLEALVPDYVKQLPRDPFAEGPLSYRLTGRIPQIYSYGPDRKDNYGSLPYNPANGVESEGDLYFP